jgi:hypothetical protein
LLASRTPDSSGAGVQRFLLPQLNQWDFARGWLDSDQEANPYASEFLEKCNQKSQVERHPNCPNRR